MDKNSKKMIFRNYIYQKKEEKSNNKNIEPADKNNAKILKFYIKGGNTLYNTVYKK